ncbi:MAG: helix-turn-helix domain-containing protein [Acidobacteriota bacterium]
MAIPVILRYGIRKTSMDEIAAAAKLSRQGLYLFFPGKEALFRDVIGYLADIAVDSLRSELARTDLPLEAGSWPVSKP